MLYIYLNKHKIRRYDAGHSLLLENVQFGRKLSFTNSPYPNCGVNKLFLMKTYMRIFSKNYSNEKL